MERVVYMSRLSDYRLLSGISDVDSVKVEQVAVMNAIEMKTKRRALFTGVVFGLLLSGIAGKAIYLHVVKSDWLKALAAREIVKKITTKGRRGTIYDSTGRELAVTLDAVSIGVNPEKIADKKKAAKQLSDTLGISYKSVVRKLSSSSPFEWVRRQVSHELADEVRALDIKGLEYIADFCRFYPGKYLAGQILGFTGTDGNGLEGLEHYYNKELSENIETGTFTRDALGRKIYKNRTEPGAYNGNSVTLTIDSTIQYIAENALKRAAKEHVAKSGIAVVMEPNSGAILAVAHYPEFNPNAFYRYTQYTWRNRAVTDPFEPGSTLKVFLAAAALESGECTPKSIFYCENGSYRIGSHNVNDTHPHQWLSLQQIIKFSSNIGAVKISDITGKKSLHGALVSFGFGKKTGIGCPGETAGILSPYRRWSKVDTGAISFGQGISVSAVQLATAVSAIANGGYKVTPYVVEKINRPDGSEFDLDRSLERKQVISEKTAGAVKRIMATVVTEGGTGVNAALKSYRVCGKTGTAQKIERGGGYSSDKYIASFVGFAPMNRPAVTVLVVLDEPKDNYYGSTVAAPAFKTIVHETLTYLDVEPEVYTKEDKVLLAKRVERDG